MEKIVVVLSLGDAREFESTANGQKEMVDVVDLVLTDGGEFMQQACTLQDYGVIG